MIFRGVKRLVITNVRVLTRKTIKTLVDDVFESSRTMVTFKSRSFAFKRDGRRIFKINAKRRGFFSRK